MVKRWLPWGLKLALSVALIWYLLGKIDLADAWRHWLDVAPAALVLACGLIVVQIVIGGMRWRAVLRAIDADLPLGKATEIFYIGTFFGSFLPSSVGDAVRMWMASRAGLGLGAAVNSVMLERAATVFGLVLMVTATQPLLLARIGHVPGAWVFPALSVAGVAGIALLALADRLPFPRDRWALTRALAKLSHDTRRLFLRPRRALGVLALAVAGHVNLTVAVWVLARGMGVELAFVDCLVLIPPVILLAVLPIMIGGWGVREGAMVVALGFVGVPEASALAVSVLFGLVGTAVSLPGGLAWLLSDDRKAQSLRV